MAIVIACVQFTRYAMPLPLVLSGLTFGCLLIIWSILCIIPIKFGLKEFAIVWVIVIILSISGLVAGISGYILKKEPKALSFLIAECTFDGRFEVIGNIEAFRQAYPESGSATIIMDIFPKDMPNENINLRISGNWQGTTGIMPVSAEDSVVFILPERMFVFYHKKPIIEYATNKMTHLYASKEYIIQLTGFPGFAIPLFPKMLNIRSREGVIITIPNFAPLKERPGWYYAIFKLG
jgi:hypothetical protein